ncbi:MAG: hypothetical protein JO247_05495 [Chloroflexi bacterium]|nr:hypothetical protein [Chloroflexota bacterium]
MPSTLCDAPGCEAELVALIRGVGLCEAHFQVVNAIAAEQGVNAAALSRPVVLAVLRSPTAVQPATPPLTTTRRRTMPSGFYWVPEPRGWTIIEVSGETFRRMGEDGASRLEDWDFVRMVPIQLPPAHARDAELRSEHRRL